VLLRRIASYLRLTIPAAILSVALSGYSESIDSYIHLDQDQPAPLRFFGSPTADLFSRELNESLQGVLEKNFVANNGSNLPAGFINASLPGFPWAGTMWSRDGGTFMRELVMRGYYEHASLVAECLMSLVEKNPDGFYTFPRYFKNSQPGWGTELDGTASVVIGMELLWERLPDGNPTKKHIGNFLFQDASPLNDIEHQLQAKPLVAGSGEFGCGLGVDGLCYNVVQNNLVRLALLASARMADEAGEIERAERYRNLADQVGDAIEKYLVDKDGAWIWCIDAKTMKPDPGILNVKGNKGIGSIDGVASMYADVLGFDPLESPWKTGVRHSEETLLDLYNTPLRKTEFDRYGIWTQFDSLAGGLLTSPSYGQGYAIQAMLLFDKLGMAQKALDWLADATYKPVPEYQLHRSSPYYFYERMYSPDAVGKIRLDEGCGALNLVNVSEPLKVSRLMLGMDDSALEYVRIIPRIPPDWKGVEARNWPIRTAHGIVRADIRFVQGADGGELTVKLTSGEKIDLLEVRMPSSHGYIWQKQKDVRVAHFVSH
jgi:hypothetical protein